VRGLAVRNLNLFKEALLEKCCGVLGGEMGFMEAGALLMFENPIG
jgi:hypothetical protein